MKRTTINSIIGKAQVLMVRSINYTRDDNGLIGIIKYDRYNTKIRRAATNEIKRLLTTKITEA